MLSGPILVLLQGTDEGKAKCFPDSHCLTKVLTGIIFCAPPRNVHLLQFSTSPNLPIWGAAGWRFSYACASVLASTIRRD